MFASSSCHCNQMSATTTTTITAAQTSKLFIKRLSEFAQLPTRGSAHAAGYDLYW